MVERRNMIKYFCLQLLHKVYLLLFVIQASTYTDGCVKPSSTVRYVSTCPITAVEWQISSLRKNCSQYSEKCQYEYHCLINPFLNATLEVCAQRVNIIERKCAEFNPGGEVIQENSLATCQRAGENCSYTYSSTTAYKYPGCYNLTKLQPNGERQITQNNENSTQRSFTIWKVILICLGCVIVIGIMILSIICWKRKRGQGSLRQGSKKESEPFVQTSELKSQTDTHENSDAEHPGENIINISPDPTYYTATDKITSSEKPPVYNIFPSPVTEEKSESEFNIRMENGSEI
ncbi:uncharacterized protein LOC133178639 [Saccostrea echinata]|uniref:uncharacterized protein LOC133178639 n=1 Tax=Saccostrea echinata TaxID=191078 RepID=UPI002A8183BE|nr:uncharacterized protein LOC133178639 [Saccostrea echinata]